MGNKNTNNTITTSKLAKKSCNNLNKTSTINLKLDDNSKIMNKAKNDTNNISFNPETSTIANNNNIYDTSTYLNMNDNTNYREDKYSDIKKSLKFIYKNNFTSSTFDDLCAHYIQSAWKNYMIKKLTKNYFSGMIEIIYSSLNSSKSTKLLQVSNILEGLKLPFRLYDLATYGELKNIVNEYSNFDDLPIIFINDFYIGNTNDLQTLVDQEILSSIVNKEYLNNCLNCNVIKVKVSEEEPIICLHCLKPYTFFSKNKVLKNIWNERYGKEAKIIN